MSFMNRRRRKLSRRTRRKAGVRTSASAYLPGRDVLMISKVRRLSSEDCLALCFPPWKAAIKMVVRTTLFTRAEARARTASYPKS